jgi:hypothetical protein
VGSHLARDLVASGGDESQPLFSSISTGQGNPPRDSLDRAIHELYVRIHQSRSDRMTVITAASAAAAGSGPGICWVGQVLIGHVLRN